MEEGSHSNEWGDLFNLNLRRLDVGMRGYLNIVLAGPITLAANDITTVSSVPEENAFYRFIEFTGTASTVTAPDINVVWNVYNNTDGGMTFRPTTGTGITIPQGGIATIIRGSDGNNFTDISSITVLGGQTINGTFDVTGAVTFGSTLNVSGHVTATAGVTTNAASFFNGVMNIADRVSIDHNFTTGEAALQVRDNTSGLNTFALYPELSNDNFNLEVVTGDIGLIFGKFVENQGTAVIGMWSSAAGAPAIRMDNSAKTLAITGSGGVTVNGNAVITSASVATSLVAGLVELASDVTQTEAAQAVTSTAGRSYGVQLNAAGQMVVNVPWVDTNTTYSTATSTVEGLVKIEDATVQTTAANAVTTTASRTYGVQLNASGQMVVNVPWVDTDTTYSAATSTVAGLVELGSDTTQVTAANGVTSNGGRTYAIQTNGAGQLVVNVPWTDGDTTYSTATTGVSGIVKLGSDTDQTVAAEAVSSTSGRTYAVQLNASDQMVVNVPWTGAAAGTVTTSGSPVADQVAVFTSADVVEGHTGLTYNATTQTLDVGTAITVGGAQLGRTRLTSNTTFTVDAAGDYTTLNEALNDLGKNYEPNGFNATVSILTGHVISTPVNCTNLDLSWVTVSPVDASIDVDLIATSAVLFTMTNCKMFNHTNSKTYNVPSGNVRCRFMVLDSCAFNNIEWISNLYIKFNWAFGATGTPSGSPLEANYTKFNAYSLEFSDGTATTDTYVACSFVSCELGNSFEIKSNKGPVSLGGEALRFASCSFNGAYRITLAAHNTNITNPIEFNNCTGHITNLILPFGTTTKSVVELINSVLDIRNYDISTTEVTTSSPITTLGNSQLRCTYDNAAVHHNGPSLDFVVGSGTLELYALNASSGKPNVMVSHVPNRTFYRYNGSAYGQQSYITSNGVAYMGSGSWNITSVTSTSSQSNATLDTGSGTAFKFVWLDPNEQFLYLGIAGQKEMNMFAMSTSGDLNTATLCKTITFTELNSTIGFGFTFTHDGQFMYLHDPAATDGERVLLYELLSPYDPESRVLLDEFNTSATTVSSTLYSIAVADNLGKLVLVAEGTDSAHSLSTMPRRLQGPVVHTLSIGAGIDPQQGQFNSTGSKFIVSTDTSTSYLKEYTLSTAFQIDTAGAATNYNVTTSGTGADGHYITMLSGNLQDLFIVNGATVYKHAIS